VTLRLETLGPMTFRLATLRLAPPCPEDAVKPGGNAPVKEPGPFHRAAARESDHGGTARAL